MSTEASEQWECKIAIRKFPCELQFPGYIAAFVDAQSNSPCVNAQLHITGFLYVTIVALGNCKH